MMSGEDSLLEGGASGSGSMVDDMEPTILDSGQVRMNGVLTGTVHFVHCTTKTSLKKLGKPWILRKICSVLNIQLCRKF